MDPSTVIALLSLNLISVGGLLHLIARRMADPAGLHGFGTGALVFGCAYLLRLQLGIESAMPVGLLSDVGMIVAVLCFAIGLQRFSGLQPLSRRTTVATVTVYLLVAGLATAQWQGVGRFGVLNLALALGYLALAALALRGARREGQVLRVPMRMLAITVGVLGVVTAVRGVAVWQVGLGPLFSGPWAQAYYSYSIAFTMLLGPNLLWMVFVRLNERLNALATHDTLTGLLNRNGLEEVVQRHFGARPPQPMVLLLVDVDHFKHINDSHGHAAGDALLHSVAQTLKAQVRGGDAVARWGGEEFLICCQATDPGWARSLAERLRLAIEALGHTTPDGSVLDCTVSVGVSAAFNERARWEAAARAADAALYEAKRAGRNRVVVAAGA